MISSEEELPVSSGHVVPTEQDAVAQAFQAAGTAHARRQRLLTTIVIVASGAAVLVGLPLLVAYLR